MSKLISIVIVAFFFIPMVLGDVGCQLGIGSQYAPGVMERTVRIRQHPGRTAYDLPAILPDVDGFIAVADCSRIGQLATMTYAGVTSRVLVVDCAGKTDKRKSDGLSGYQWMKNFGIVLEMNRDLAEKLGIPVGRGAKGVTLCYDN